MQSNTEKHVSDTLDRLHRYASQASLECYLSLFAENAVFMGTDKNERWPLEIFRPYVTQRFKDGIGWTYQVIKRNISICSEETVAWFDERLYHETGEARGSGVLVLIGSEWKITQYNLCFPITNQLLHSFRDIMRIVG